MRTRVGITGLVLVAGFALSAVGASPTSAAVCLEILNPAKETGNYTSAANCRSNTLGAGNWVFATPRIEIPDEPDHQCAKVPAGRTTGLEGWGTELGCLAEVGQADGGPFIRVKDPVVKGGTHKAEFRVLPSTKTFKGTSGPLLLKAGTTAAVKCTEDTNTGEITSMDTIGKTVLKFTGCTLEGNKKICTAKSVGAGEGEIVTKTLKGELGTVKSSEAPSEVGLLIEAETSKKLIEVEKDACTPLEATAPVEGSVAAEVFLPVGEEQTSAGIELAVTSGKQRIKAITVLSGEKKPELTAFGVGGVTGEDVEEFEFGGPIEVI